MTHFLDPVLGSKYLAFKSPRIVLEFVLVKAVSAINGGGLNRICLTSVSSVKLIYFFCVTSTGP